MIDKSLDLDRLSAEGLVKLEITGGIPTWEASPSPRHQRTAFLIQTSIKSSLQSSSGCECDNLADIYIRFKDGSIKRPDIAIFCVRQPDQDEALDSVPEAVIEIISVGYEYKDKELNPAFYLSQGVKDVIVVDPRSGEVTHYRSDGTGNLHAPVTIDLECGCQCTVP